MPWVTPWSVPPAWPWVTQSGTPWSVPRVRPLAIPWAMRWGVPWAMTLAEGCPSSPCQSPCPAPRRIPCPSPPHRRPQPAPRRSPRPSLLFARSHEGRGAWNATWAGTGSLRHEEGNARGSRPFALAQVDETSAGGPLSIHPSIYRRQATEGRLIPSRRRFAPDPVRAKSRGRRCRAYCLQRRSSSCFWHRRSAPSAIIRSLLPLLTPSGGAAPAIFRENVVTAFSWAIPWVIWWAMQWGMPWGMTLGKGWEIS